MTEKEVYQKGVALLEEWEDVNYCEHTFKFKDDWLDDKEVVDLLNGLYEENEQLKRRNKGLQSELQIFKEDVTHSNLQINKLADENEQLKKEMEKLKAQLLYTDSVCDICNNHNLVKKDKYYISKCEKGHEECSKIDLNYCEDFELVGDYK